MGDTKATLTAILVDAVSGPARGIKAEITGIGTSVSHVTSLLQGIGQGIGQQIFLKLSEGISAVTGAIPALLDQGHDYLEFLHQIQLETGMTAEETSTLVGAFKALGVPTDDLDTLFARLGKNLGSNEGLFRQLGVATRDTNGDLLSSYQIVQNLRQAIAEHGESLLTTAAAQDLFGRSGFKIIEALQASDPEWKAAIDNVRRWGGVVNQATIDNADRLHDTLDSLGQGITDIGVNIAAAVDPFLRTFVDSFASFVQSHLNEIVDFAVGVVNVVTGFISGLFGITDALGASSGAAADSTNHASAAASNYGKTLSSAAGGADAFTTAINAHIKAIDAETQALQAAQQRRQAIQERARLADSLAAAQAQLADLRGNAPFTAGLSDAETVLARQKHAQDIIDAEKDVADKRQAIGDFEADQKDRAEAELLSRQKARLQDELTAHKAANAAITASGLQMDTTLDKNTTSVLSNLGIKTQEFGKTAVSSFATGVAAANGFLDVLLGVQHVSADRGEGTFRTGGVVGALGQLATVLGHVADAAGHAVGFLAQLVPEATKPIPGTSQPGQPGASWWDIWSTEFKLLLGNVPGFATGGVARATPGGTIIRVGEGTEDEGIFPLSFLSRGSSRSGPVIHNHFEFMAMPSGKQLKDVIDLIDEQLSVRYDNAPVGLPGFRARG